MKKLIFVFSSSFLLLMIIWLFIGYSEYGDEIVNKHLDLQTMIYRLDDLEIDMFDFIDNIKKFADNLVADSDVSVIDNISSFFLRSLISLFDILHVVSKSIVSVILFVFKPVFY